MTVANVLAQDLFRSAYENRYTWDKSFPGYKADVTYRCDDQTFTGRIEVGANLKAQIFDIEDDAALKEIQGQLFEITIHRIRRTFEETHSANTFSYGAVDESGAQEILMGGKAEGDSYKIANNEVCMVNRRIHGVRVKINTFSSHDTGEGYLSHKYDSVYTDPETGALKGGKSDFVDEYEKAGAYTILNHRLITTDGNDSGSSQEFTFSNIELS